MKHIIAIVLKFVVVLVLLEILLSLMTALTVSQILLISAAVTLASYVVADLLILAVSNNTTATLCEAILTFIVIYLFNYVRYYNYITVGTSVVCAVVLSAAQWFYHKYVAITIHTDRKKGRRRT